MPQQAVFFDERTAFKRVQVLKVYDVAYARSCFDEMSEDALASLSRSLNLASKYEEPLTELVWEDIEDEAREDGSVLSFFVVLEEKDNQHTPLYVSPDWPSAEKIARTILEAA